MSADRHDLPDDVRQFAPKDVRQPHDDGTMRPILERLNRGTNGAADSRFALPPVEPAGREQRRRLPWRLIAAGTVTAGASAGLAFAAFAWFAPVAHAPTQQETFDLAPKRVQTVSFKEERLPESAPVPSRSQTDVPANETPANAPGRQAQSDTAAHNGEAVAGPVKPAVGTASDQSRKPIGPKELIALWSGIPSDVTAQGSSETPPAQAAEANGGDESAQPAEAKPAHQRQAHVRRGHRHTHRHVAHRRTAPAEAAAPTQEAAAQPAQAPVQSAWQALFGHPVATAGPSGTTTAAFQ